MSQRGLKIDRDLNGAINIFLKYAKEHPEKALVAPGRISHPLEQGLQTLEPRGDSC